MPRRTAWRHLPIALLTLAFSLGFSGEAEAFVWPNVPERVARGLASTDPSERRAAAQDIAALPFETAKPLAMKALGDEDDEVRIAAAKVAVRLKLPAASDLVIAWLTDTDSRVRLAACEVIRAAPTARAVTALGRVLADPSQDVRVVAAQAMGRSASSEAVSLLLGHLDDSSPEVRGEVAAALGRLGDARAVLPLVGKVQDTSAEVRRRVARALGVLKDTRAASALVLALSDVSAEVRVEAATALGRLGSDEATVALAPLVQSSASARSGAPAAESSQALRQAALRALGRIGSARAIDLVVASLEGDRPEAARTPARDALAALGSKAEKALTAALAGSPSPRVALGAVQALGAIGDPAAAPVIVRALGQGLVPAPAALAALGQLRAESALTTVLELIDDPAPEVRRAAIAAAAAIEDPSRPDGRAVDPVRDALSDPDMDAEDRVALLTLLGRAGAPRGAELLLGFVGSKNVALRRAALRSLGSLATSSAAIDEALAKALDDEIGSVRMDAAVAIARVGRADLTERLRDRLMKGAEQDRGALGVALSGVSSRVRSEEIVKKLADDVAAAPTSARDALIESVGRALAGSSKLLETLALASVDDRRKVAEVLGARGDRASTEGASAMLVGLTRDPDPGVRANAVWSLGTVGDKGAAASLTAALGDANVDVATNAAAALGRVAAKLGDPAIAAPLCAALSDPRSYVRANAVSGLALAGGHCDEALVLPLLASDPSERVRIAVARWLRATASSAASAQKALERCVSEEATFRVAKACEEGPRPAIDAKHAVTVFVTPDGASSPVPRAPFALVLADGTIRAGLADRRGAVFEPASPDGGLELTVPAALAIELTR